MIGSLILLIPGVRGLNFGIDANTPGLRLPFIGRIGMDDTSRP